MRKMIIFCFAISMTFAGALSVSAEENLVESVLSGCKTELDTYCKDVTPGDSRILACLYSRSDKLSGKCEYALYDAAVQLERAIAALSFWVNECADDLNTFCKGVEAGEGRLLTCLDNNAKDVSARCKEAIAEVGSK